MEKLHLSDGEWTLMEVLWSEAPKTITQMTAELAKSTGWSKHTIISMLGRMEKKGAVRYEAGERAKLYYPAVERSQIAAEKTESFLEKIYSGSLGLLVNTMVAEKALSKEDIDELYGILKKAEEEIKC